MKLIYRILLVGLLAASPSIYGGGFQINEHGSRGMAIGGSFTSNVCDPSALYYNASAITRLSGLRLMLGTTLIAPSTTFRGPLPSITETEMESQLFTPIHGYVTYQLDDKMFLGFGVNNPYGLGTKWDENWVGRYVSVEYDLQTFVFYPTFAYKVNDQLSVGASLKYGIALVNIVSKSKLHPFEGDAKVSLEGNEYSAFGFNVGVTYSPTEKLNLGLTYKSEMTYTFDGEATAEAPDEVLALVPKGDAGAELTIPQQIIFGASYEVMPKLSVSADFQYVFWSVYDKLLVDFADESYEDIESVRNYEDTYIARFGAQYQLNEKMWFGAGYLFDRNPIPGEYLDSSLPDANRHGASFGLGYKVTDALQIDFAYLYLRFNERMVTNSDVNYSGTDGFAPFNGVYNSSSHLLSLSFMYNL